ncbi:hypothetical protein K439DRAFT_1628665 [Ramaria rubella]|nr:hypothetical protein K439DRAFT_1628665 [Ramaria rubella]
MLRELTIGGAMSELTLMNCWTILSNCPNIELFDMTSIKSDFPVPPSMEITLRCLRELRIGPFTPDPGPLMHCIKAPALQHLRMIVDRDVNFDSSCITCLVQESRPPLTILSLANMDGKDVALCLPLLPNLVSVTLQHTRAMDLVLCCLTAQDDQGRPHCPLLEHLGLRLSLFTGGHLVRFARERRKAASGLRVLVDNRSRYKPGDFAGLTIELSLVGEFTDSELKELYDLQT